MQVRLNPSLFGALSLFLVVIFTKPKSINGDLLGNILSCSPSARYILHECYAEYERERDEHGGHPYCCIYAKYRGCLKEKMDIWCRRSIQQLVDGES